MNHKVYEHYYCITSYSQESFGNNVLKEKSEIQQRKLRWATFSSMVSNS